VCTLEAAIFFRDAVVEHSVVALNSCRMSMETNDSEISETKLFELFQDAIARCGTPMLRKQDDDLAYDLYELFDVDAQSFLHDSVLEKLQSSSVIDEELAYLSRAMRNEWFELRRSSWELDQIRDSAEWRQFFVLCDAARKKLEELRSTRDV
jgi:hypothetical protein